MRKIECAHMYVFMLSIKIKPDIEEGFENGDGVDFFVGAMENVSSFLSFCCSVGVFERANLSVCGLQILRERRCFSFSVLLALTLA